MAYSLEQFQEVCLLLKNGGREQVQPSDDFDEIDRGAFDFFVAVATPELLPFIYYNVIMLAEAGSGSIGVGEDAIKLVNERRDALRSLLTKNQPISNQFKNGLKNTEIVWQENLDVWATVFSNSILRIVDFDGWAESQGQ